ncbi:glycosyltransferase family 4 protein [Aestuariivivens marinum]|uniref:glycosyltransferase family 4 protein n=1 Tax=Aestuariivivens marinum TaxID=2913555 RepID=UPI001F5A8447|nr:glycosyltransferase family 4 protein [Aestuariivivens marinum]
MRIYILSKEWARHGNNSGYQRIVNYLTIAFKYPKSLKIPFKLASYLKRKTRVLNYRSETISKELFILFKVFKSKQVHILYGDMDFYFLHYLKRFPFNLRKNTLVATFHHPPYELEKRLHYNRKKVLGTLDKIIVMGPNQISFFKKYSNADIKFIPHGINTEITNNLKPIERKNQLLLVGTSHRDHQRNSDIMKALANDLDVSFVVIMFMEHAKLYKDLPNVTCLTHNVLDNELYNYYASSKGLLMSLKDCTASNAILEAMVYKCPLIINNVGAVKDYLPEGSGVPVFETDDIQGTLDYIKKLLNDDNYINEMVANQQRLVENYNWTKIAKETEDFIYSKKN